MEVDRLIRLQRAHHARYVAIQHTAFDLVGAAWDRFGGLDDAAMRAFAAAAAEIIDASKVQVSTVTAGYMAAVDVTVAEGIAPVIATPPVIRNGVSSLEVYARSVVEARVRIAAGATFEDAMTAGRARATGTALTDVNLTNKATIDRVAPLRPWVVGYRRVLTGRSCALCAAASTQRYRRPNLMPIHQRCDCDVAEIYGTADPGRVINRDLYRDLKAEGVIDDIAAQRQVSRLEETLTGQRDRLDRLRAEMRAERDQERETRLEQRIDKEQQKIAATERRIETARQRRTEREATAGGRPASFYVDQRGGIFRADGTPVRVRTEQNPEVGPVLVAA